MNASKRLVAGLALAAALPAHGQQAAPYVPSAPPVMVMPAQAGANPFLQFAPPPTFGFNPFVLITPQAPPGPAKPYTMHPSVPPEVKKQIMQMAMPLMANLMHMTMPDAMNWFVVKYKAKPGLSFNDVLDSMNLRANQLNFKHVGENLMWKDFKAVLGDNDAPRVEVHSYCDIKVGRDLLRISPEFVAFLPCRIAVMEDSDKNIWVVMLDWNLDWIKGYENQMGITPELAKGAMEIRDKMDQIMRAGANGDL